MSTPVLSLFSFPIRHAIGAGALFNLIISLPATAAFLAMDWQTPGRPADSVGDVAMFCVAALSLPVLFVAPCRLLVDSCSSRSIAAGGVRHRGPHLGPDVKFVLLRSVRIVFI